MKSLSTTDYKITTEIRNGHKWFILRDKNGKHLNMYRKYHQVLHAIEMRIKHNIDINRYKNK